MIKLHSSWLSGLGVQACRRRRDFSNLVANFLIQAILKLLLEFIDAPVDFILDEDLDLVLAKCIKPIKKKFEALLQTVCNFLVDDRIHVL